MTTPPPPPPNQPPQGGFGAPQEPEPPQQPQQPGQDPRSAGFGAPQQPPAGGFGAPQEPPAGGFGAPQDPRSGGFGAPQPPPAAPYGAPQQPPAAPYGAPQPSAAPQGYGYPQAQPPGYGYPQPPTAPMYGPGAPAPQPPGGGKAKRNQLLILASAFLAIALIVVGGFWYASRPADPDAPKKPVAEGKNGGSTGSTGGSGTAEPAPVASEKAPSNPKSTKLVSVPQPKIERLHNVAGSWLTDSVYVKSDILKVVGYDLATGKSKWSIPLPGQVCAATKRSSGDKAAIVYEPAKRTGKYAHQPCTEVAVIDLNAGRLLWQGSAKSSAGGDEKVEFKEITLAGQTVAAAGLQGGAAWDLATGKSRWIPKVDSESCYDAGYAGGAGLAVIRKCGEYNDRYLMAQALDPVTGAPLSSYKLPQGIQYASIISAKPLVVTTDLDNGGGITDIFSVDEKTGTLKARIGLPKDTYAPNCSTSTGVEVCDKVVVGNGRVYLPSEEHEDTAGEKYDETNEIVSFDLATGKQTTDRFDAGSRFTMFPLRMDGPNIIAYKWPPYDKGGQVVSIDTKTGKQTLLMDNPGDEASRNVETSFSSNFSEIRYHNGRLFASEVLIDKPFRPEDAKRDFLFAGFAAN
ncbi:PQQ-binding-like beta-propeller repeat protein [Streptomyces bambusae]|uniref:outer membrane protein assembly factor BamB family protein n=1 Tax=Streptomyces bambusae TaxID=1550616 RepID=UPI001CFEA6DE|nr:PQQ-binding-like beta-propeller repeat protein [Streptomyces bambusae]MCB5167933.1 PQQ-binding-like beta-propeller repeat protein [Streptomyces bambusae]